MSAAPNRPNATSAGRCSRFTPSSAIRARIPPTPSLSTRMAQPTYLIVVITISVQMINDRIPRSAAEIENGLERVERARADIAKHHAERGDHPSGLAEAHGRRRVTQAHGRAHDWPQSIEAAAPDGRGLACRRTSPSGGDSLARR